MYRTLREITLPDVSLWGRVEATVLEVGGTVGIPAPIANHQQMTEVHIEWQEGKREVETERPICRVCWVEGTDGHPRRADWPCDAVRIADRTTDPCPSCGEPREPIPDAGMVCGRGCGG